MLQAGDGMGAAGRFRGVCVRKVRRGEGFFVLFFLFFQRNFHQVSGHRGGPAEKKKNFS